jgi:hypothetical protein
MGVVLATSRVRSRPWQLFRTGRGPAGPKAEKGAPVPTLTYLLNIDTLHVLQASLEALSWRGKPRSAWGTAAGRFHPERPSSWPNGEAGMGRPATSQGEEAVVRAVLVVGQTSRFKASENRSAHGRRP